MALLFGLFAAALAAWIACVCCLLAAGGSCVLASFLLGRLLAALQLQEVVRCLAAFIDVFAGLF